MYEQAHGLSGKPFGLSPDPNYLYLSAQHREAATGLIYGIVKRKGLMTLVGPAGTGKTTVLRAVMGALGRSAAELAYIAVPTLNVQELLEMVLLQYGLVRALGASKAERLILLEQFLLRAYEQDRPVVLMIDEAHRLSAELLEEIRLLTNYDSGQSSLMQIILAGQEELDERLRRPGMEQLKQRVAYRFVLGPLGAEDVRGYLAHRWRKAGGQEIPFDEDALEAVAVLSGGVPRLINAICDNALTMAFAEGSARVTRSMVYSAAEELDMVTPGRAGAASSMESAPVAEELEQMLTLAREISGDGDSLSIPRRIRGRKESWLVRSARRLLGRRAESVDDQDLRSA